MSTYEDRRDRRLHEAYQQAMQQLAEIARLPPEKRYAPAYGALYGLFAAFFIEMAEYLTPEQLYGIRYALDQFKATMPAGDQEENL